MKTPLAAAVSGFWAVTPVGPNRRNQRTAFETGNGRSALAVETAVHAPFATFKTTPSNGEVAWKGAVRARPPCAVVGLASP
jgi:hypothetical protein